MQKSTSSVAAVLDGLTLEARRHGLNDASWCRAAGVRKETLSRLRKRSNCDFATLAALAGAVGARVGLLSPSSVETTQDGHFPATVGREYEQRLADLVASNNYDPKTWRSAGPAFFVAGLAVFAASMSGFDRRRLLDLAEQIHPGSSRADVLGQWLERSPVRPSRFAPMVRQRLRSAA